MGPMRFNLAILTGCLSLACWVSSYLIIMGYVGDNSEKPDLGPQGALLHDKRQVTAADVKHGCDVGLVLAPVDINARSGCLKSCFTSRFARTDKSPWKHHVG